MSLEQERKRNIELLASRVLTEDHNLIKEGAYDQDWIKALTNIGGRVAKVTVDKERKLKPLYGGGNYCFIGYLISFHRPMTAQKLILEGLQINGKFVDASVIIEIDGRWQVHSGLGIDFNIREDFQTNVKKVKKAVEKKIAEYDAEPENALRENKEK